MNIEPLSLTDLHRDQPGVRRLTHGLATAGTWRRLVQRGIALGSELATALPRDLSHALSTVSPPRVDAGFRTEPEAVRIALYVHYSATGHISEMVWIQLAHLRENGFAIVFISMAANIPYNEWQAVRYLCALVVRRQNFGRDFGAWRDLLPEVQRRWPAIEELLLANDSVLGPLRSLTPLFETMRAGGDGLFGLTESLQGGPHLQSYMLLARGRPVVQDVMQFIGSVYISHSKWLLVQMAELRLARRIQQRGHRVAAVYGYDRLIRAASIDPSHRPLNPTHHLWRVLVTQFGYPFIKTDLVRHNPGNLPNVAEWTEVIPLDAPCSVPVLQAHLETLGEMRWTNSA